MNENSIIPEKKLCNKNKILENMSYRNYMAYKNIYYINKEDKEKHEKHMNCMNSIPNKCLNITNNDERHMGEWYKCIEEQRKKC